MIDAKYEYGTKVRLVTNVRNDGSFPGKMKGDLLLRRGSEGYVQQAGIHLQEHVIYQVHFIEQNLIVGCKESELMDAAIAWRDNEFEYGDKAQLTLDLASEGTVLAKTGDVVSVLAVDRDEPESIYYRIQCGELDVMVPERALCALSPEVRQQLEMLNDHVA